MELKYFEYEITVSKGEATSTKKVDFKFIDQDTAQKYHSAKEAIQALKVPNSEEEITQELIDKVSIIDNLVDEASFSGAIVGIDGNGKIDIDTSKLEQTRVKIVAKNIGDTQIEIVGGEEASPATKLEEVNKHINLMTANEGVEISAVLKEGSEYEVIFKNYNIIETKVIKVRFL